MLRLIRLAESGWLRSGSIAKDPFRAELEDILDQSDVRPRERDFILSEVDQEYPWLSSLYPSESVI